MGELSTRLEKTTYSSSRDDKEVRFVANEDDEVRTTVRNHRYVWQQVSTEEPSVCTQVL
jgi:hypothetical protein